MLINVWGIFDMARKQSWFDSTLFIWLTTAIILQNWRYESYEYHHIPLFFYGNVLKEELEVNQEDS
jgi:hypothetical protein